MSDSRDPDSQTWENKAKVEELKGRIARLEKDFQNYKENQREWLPKDEFQDYKQNRSDWKREALAATAIILSGVIGFALNLVFSTP
ncbi:hypothetical protein [Candidatus Nanohalobium constans]|uniref:Uncharacterized protein n=1 Tax=Candidatus Nanohalobium constans TaxID=2565781 RepID=A0A5Q0UHD4_9ARCH|nr:hypothetical protein [Candidatus Nanohalobium constans]QGA80620.1 hypothetical protein LC1Nh_0733 [Candidatus Nanohalobium constans]